MLAKHRDHAQKLYEEMAPYDVTDDTTLATLPYLQAVINETLRLCPSQMTGGNRVTSDEGLWIDDRFIPPNTKIAAPKYSIMRRK